MSSGNSDKRGVHDVVEDEILIIHHVLLSTHCVTDPKDWGLSLRPITEASVSKLQARKITTAALFTLVPQQCKA